VTERQGSLLKVESGETANSSADPIFEALTLTICELFASEFWSETMRPLAEKIAAEMTKRFQIIPKGRS
jgi:NhaP-type Na+/H+ and K+/H+ antiporter